jgi:hypothetical protein
MLRCESVQQELSVQNRLQKCVRVESGTLAGGTVKLSKIRSVSRRLKSGSVLTGPSSVRIVSFSQIYDAVGQTDGSSEPKTRKL